eukprot:SAG25_NODE_2873_length_1340_cov_1.448026_1_plen_41_part_10
MRWEEGFFEGGGTEDAHHDGLIGGAGLACGAAQKARALVVS